jgi:hypothetical protein
MRSIIITGGFMLVLAAMMLAPSVSAQLQYGTANIALSQSSISLARGSSAAVNYTVTLASGKPWGTNINIINSGQLSFLGINVSITNQQMQDPPWSGVIRIQPSTGAVLGTYYLFLNTTGDDPTTSNAALAITITNGTSSTSGAGTTTVSATTTATTTIAQKQTTTSIAQSGGYGSSSGSSGWSAQTANNMYLVIGIIITLVAMAIAMFKMKQKNNRLILFSAALIAIGVIVWLYGDYSGGLLQYIWTGVLLIAVGTILWLFADFKGIK